MATARIRIDQAAHPTVPVGQPGIARDDLVLGQPVSLRNSNNTDVLRWAWTMVDRPIGSTAVLSGTTGPQVVFTPDVEGSYLIRLAINDGIDGQIDLKVAAVRDGLGFRYPATGETAESVNWPTNDGKGWGKDGEALFRNVGGVIEDLAATLAVGNTTGGSNIQLDAGDAIVGDLGGEIRFTGPGNIELNPDTNVTVNGDLEVTGKLTVAGLIDPTGLVLDEQVSVPFTPPVDGKGTLWCMDVAGITTLMFTTDLGVDQTVANMGSVTLEAVLDAGQTTGGKNLIVSNGDSIVGAGGGSISFSVAGLIALTDASGTILWLAGAELGDGPAGADELVIGDGSAANFGATIFSGPAAVGGYLMTDTAGTFQGGIRYDHSADALYLDAGGAARAYVAATGLHPNATDTYDLGLTGTRWRDGWFSRALYIAGAESGDAQAGSDEFIVGDGAASYGMTIFTGAASLARISFTDTAGTFQGQVSYSHTTDALFLSAGGSARTQLTSTGFHPNAHATYDLGLTGTRWNDVYLSGELYVSGGVTGHDANGDDISIGDGSASARGTTIYSTTGGAHYFADTVGGTQGGVTYLHGTDKLTLRAAAGDRVNVTSSSCSPQSDNTFDLGEAAKQWMTVYVGTSVVTPLVSSSNTLTLTATNIVVTNHGYHSVRGSTVRGLVNTMIYRWTSVVDDVGTDISYTDDADAGGYWTIDNAGVYSVSCSIDVGHAGYIAIKMAAALSNTFDQTSILVAQDVTGGNSYSMSWTGFCTVNSIIWIATSSATNPTGTPVNNNRVTVTRVR